MYRNGPLILPSNSDGTDALLESVTGHVIYDRFLIEDELADSGSAPMRAFAAKDLKDYCRRVVLRVVELPSDVSGSSSPTYVQLCKAIADLRHPAIEEVTEFGDLDSERQYSIAAIAEGQRLSDLFQAGRRATLDQITAIIEPLSKALGAAHSKNVLHCAVNPSNVIVSDIEDPGRTKVRLINFGVAWPVDIPASDLNCSERPEHPIFFAPPETLSPLGHRSPASDVYSFSALVYWLFCGRAPFHHSEREGLLASIAAGTVELPSSLRTDVTRTADRLLLTGLSAEMSQRPQNIEDLGQRLIQALEPPRIPVAPVRQPRKKQSKQVDEATKPASLPRFLEQPKPVAKVAVRRTIAAPKATTFSDRTVTWSLIVLLLAAALSIPLVRAFLNDGAKVSAVSSIAEPVIEQKVRREVRYSIARLGTNDADASNSFLTLTSDTAGEFYVFQELARPDGPMEFKQVFPAQAGVAAEAGKPVKVSLKNEMAESETKALWVVWTAAATEELGRFQGGAKNDEARGLKHFLERNRDLKVEVGSDTVTGQTSLVSTSERIVHRLVLDPLPALTAKK